MTRWYEDIAVGEPFPLGRHNFTEAEIIAFGKAYDPQYLHTDPGAAKAGPFDGLVASGWHTVSAGHRLMVDALAAEGERLRAAGRPPGVPGPSPGVNQAEFKAPVRPGDTIAYTLVVTAKRPSNSLPGWGLLFNPIEGRNQRDEIVYRAEVVAFSKLRDYRPPFKVKAALALRRALGKPTGF
jgi:acyl dehydratase